MEASYQLRKVTYSTGDIRKPNYAPGGEYHLKNFPTLEEAKQYAKDNLKIGKTFWKRNTQGDLYARSKDEVCHYTIDEVLKETK